MRIYFEITVSKQDDWGNIIHKPKCVSTIATVEKQNEDGTFLLKVDSVDTLSDFAIYDPSDESVVLL